jgi:hypothetical protein
MGFAIGCPNSRTIFVRMKPDHYRWQDFVIPPQRVLTDLIATVAVIIVSVTAVVASGETSRDDPRPVNTAAVMTPWVQAPPLAQTAKPPTRPRLTENCL